MCPNQWSSTSNVRFSVHIKYKLVCWNSLYWSCAAFLAGVLHRPCPPVAVTTRGHSGQHGRLPAQFHQWLPGGAAAGGRHLRAQWLPLECCGSTWQTTAPAWFRRGRTETIDGRQSRALLSTEAPIQPQRSWGRQVTGRPVILDFVPSPRNRRKYYRNSANVAVNIKTSQVLPPFCAKLKRCKDHDWHKLQTAADLKMPQSAANVPFYSYFSPTFSFCFLNFLPLFPSAFLLLSHFLLFEVRGFSYFSTCWTARS